jgi:hypothetical protein
LFNLYLVNGIDICLFHTISALTLCYKMEQKHRGRNWNPEKSIIFFLRHLPCLLEHEVVSCSDGDSHPSRLRRPPAQLSRGAVWLLQAHLQLRRLHHRHWQLRVLNWRWPVRVKGATVWHDLLPPPHWPCLRRPCHR